MRRATSLGFRIVLALVGAAGTASLSCDDLRVADLRASDAGDASGGGTRSPADGLDAGDVPLDASAEDAPSSRRTVQVLASGFHQPLEIALSEDTVWFTLEHDPTATVRKVRKDGAGSDVVSAHDAASGLNPLGGGILVVGPDVVWSNRTAGSGAIFAAPLAGGPERVIEGLLDRPYHLAYFAGHVYFSDEAVGTTPYALQRVPLAGGSPTTLATFQIRVGGIAVDAIGIYWTQGGALANGKNGVRRRPIEGSADATVDLYVGNDNGDIGGIALGPDEVFWADTESGRIMKVGKAGGIATVLADSLASPMRVAFDGTHVYFTQHGSGTAANGKVSRVPAAGGPVEDLATSLDHPVGVAVDATHVYWTAYGGGEVARTEK